MTARLQDVRRYAKASKGVQFSMWFAPIVSHFLTHRRLRVSGLRLVCEPTADVHDLRTAWIACSHTVRNRFVTRSHVRRLLLPSLGLGRNLSKRGNDQNSEKHERHYRASHHRFFLGLLMESAPRDVRFLPAGYGLTSASASESLQIGGSMSASANELTRRLGHNQPRQAYGGDFADCPTGTGHVAFSDARTAGNGVDPGASCLLRSGRLASPVGCQSKRLGCKLFGGEIVQRLRYPLVRHGRINCCQGIAHWSTPLSWPQVAETRNETNRARKPGHEIERVLAAAGDAIERTFGGEKRRG